MNSNELLVSAAQITAAFAGNERCHIDDIPRVLRDTFATLEQLARGDQPAPGSTEPAKPEPAVSVRKSLASPDHIISMIDGKPYKTLRRHLTTHGYTPDEYRAAFDLKADYPMVAASYSASRRAMALEIGLGTKANRGA